MSAIERLMAIRGDRNSGSGTIGSRRRASICRKVPSAAIASTKAAMIAGLEKPLLPPSMKA
jgi:hypothetical protein